MGDGDWDKSRESLCVAIAEYADVSAGLDVYGVDVALEFTEEARRFMRAVNNGVEFGGEGHAFVRAVMLGESKNWCVGRRLTCLSLVAANAATIVLGERVLRGLLGNRAIASATAIFFALESCHALFGTSGRGFFDLADRSDVDVELFGDIVGSGDVKTADGFAEFAESNRYANGWQIEGVDSRMVAGAVLHNVYVGSLRWGANMVGVV